jgi:hypothetical protein
VRARLLTAGKGATQFAADASRDIWSRSWVFPRFGKARTWISFSTFTASSTYSEPASVSILSGSVFSINGAPLPEMKLSAGAARPGL